MTTESPEKQKNMHERPNNIVVTQPYTYYYTAFKNIFIYCSVQEDQSYEILLLLFPRKEKKTKCIFHWNNKTFFNSRFFPLRKMAIK